MKRPNYKQVLAVAVPVWVTAGYILELHARIKGLQVRGKYYEEKLDSALRKLTPEKLEEMAQEVESDTEFFEISQTTLKDTL
jgi:hypothetical protein